MTDCVRQGGRSASYQHDGSAIAASLALVTSLGAQAGDTARGPEVGARVRVFAPELRTDITSDVSRRSTASVMVLDTGEVRTVLGMEIGPVLVDQYRLVTIRLSTIEALEVSGGAPCEGSMWRGALLGALIGGVIFGLGAMPEVNPDASDFMRGRSARDSWWARSAARSSAGALAASAGSPRRSRPGRR